MRKLLPLCFVLFLSARLLSQSASDAAVQLSANIQSSPAQITLNWAGNSTTSQYQVFRKLKSASTWGSLIANLSGTTNQYVDNSVSPGISYEYRVIRVGSGYTGYGYINSGIAVPEIGYRGRLILLVDSTFITSLTPEIQRLTKDIEGDGWDVARINVSRTASVYHVKDLIVGNYHLDSINLKAVFILGHVPVPYSGNINPDGHPDHLGAWPADCYYGDVDGTWTDISVNSTTASPARTQNVPGDTKFDQSVVPTDIELQVGRVDFNNMPAFTQTEQQLLKNYLDKDHDYRKKLFVPVKRAVIDDNFGYFSSEAFAASGYKNFGPLVGTSSVTAADYFTSMTGNSYLWSYGCGGGTYNSAGGIGTTANFSTANLQGVFTMLFGSYFGDWDSQDNFLKAPLAQGKVLTSVWSGRPHYQFHHMAQGENIGYDLLMTQNNPNALYYASPTGITGRWVHNALMGDPTLRTDILSPVSNVIATKVGNNCNISWSASTEPGLIGYNIYMKNDSLNSYIKINTSPVTGTTYTDNCLIVKGVYSYMVRALKLELNPSGSYYNMSEGIADTAYNANNYAAIAAFTYSASGVNIVFTNLSTLPTTYQWDFGNGTTGTAANPVVTYTANGYYLVSLIASSGCYVDTTNQILNLTEVGIASNELENSVGIFPNPASNKIKITYNSPSVANVTILSNDGRLVYTKKDFYSNDEIDLGQLSRGLYIVKLTSGAKTIYRKLLLE